MYWYSADGKYCGVYLRNLITGSLQIWQITDVVFNTSSETAKPKNITNSFTVIDKGKEQKLNEVTDNGFSSSQF